MTGNPLKIIQNKELELGKKLQLKKQEAAEKIADFKNLQHKKLADLPSSLTDEINKIKLDLSDQASREIRAGRKVFEKQMAQLDKINEKEIRRLSDEIADNLIKEAS